MTTHAQRITVTTMDRECADTLFQVLTHNGWELTHHVASYTIVGDDTYTVSHRIPCVSGNGPITNVWNAIARYVPVILEYRSEAE